VFREIDTRAHGAASIAQVHRARLQDGTPVVLKVRRPGVRETIDADLRLLRRVSELIESEMPEARRYRPAEIAEQFAKSLEREADFAVETRNIERFAKNFAGDPHIVILASTPNTRATCCWCRSTSTGSRPRTLLQ